MELDEPVGTAQIIERKSLEAPPEVVVIDPEEPPAKVSDKSSEAIVVLDDDEEEPQPAGESACAVIDLVGKKSCNTKCINYACNSGKEMMVAPGLCLQYFRVKNAENKRREVCRQCYMMAMEHYDKLAGALVRGDSVFNVEFPLRNDMFEIDDSDSENDNEEEDEYYEGHCMEYLEKEFTTVLEETLNEFKFDRQVEEGVKYLKERSKPLEEDFKMVNDEIRSLRQRLDSVQLNLYKQFPVKYKEEPPVDLFEDGRIVFEQLKTKQKTGEVCLIDGGKRGVVVFCF